MSHLFDKTIQHALKIWADQHEPPANGRARLLLLASTSSPRAAHISSFRRFDRFPRSHTSRGLGSNLASDVFHNPWMWRLNLA